MWKNVCYYRCFRNIFNVSDSVEHFPNFGYLVGSSSCVLKTFYIFILSQGYIFHYLVKKFEYLGGLFNFSLHSLSKLLQIFGLEGFSCLEKIIGKFLQYPLMIKDSIALLIAHSLQPLVNKRSFSWAYNGFLQLEKNSHIPF